MNNPLQQLSLHALRQRTSIKWRRYPKDVLPLWVAEMDVPVAEPIVTAITDALAMGDTGYPAGQVYAEALAMFARQRWGWELPIADTRLVPDVMLGAVEVLKLVTGPGDAVVVNSPVYPPFYMFIEHLPRRVVEAPLDADHRIDMAVLRDVFRDVTSQGRRAAYLLCSPHNPTGTVHTAEELSTVAELAEQYGVRVVADEIHAPVVLPGAAFVPYLCVPGSERGFSLLSASKGWSLAGLKAAVAVAGAGSADELATMPEEVGHGASHLGVIAHAAALTEGIPWLDAVIAQLDVNRRLLAELLAARVPQVAYRPPQATYLAWLDCRALGLGDDPAAVFLDRGRVALHAGADFGTGGAGHARLTLATTPDILGEAVARMARAL